MTGDASLMYYCDACTAELAITLTRTAEGWVNDTADKQLAVEGWLTLTTTDGVKVYCDGCGPDMTQAQRDDLVTAAARALNGTAKRRRSWPGWTHGTRRHSRLRRNYDRYLASPS